MKLAFSPASPYVRKVMACAVARGIDGQIEKWVIPTTDAALSDTDLAVSTGVTPFSTSNSRCL